VKFKATMAFFLGDCVCACGFYFFVRLVLWAVRMSCERQYDKNIEISKSI
jgi:hypothetical protein